MSTLQRYVKQLPVSLTTLLLGGLLSLTTGASLYSITAKTIESDAEERFRSMARVAQYTISARIKSYTDMLRSTTGLFRAAPDITAEQFEAYVQQLDLKQNFPGIQVINYAVTVDEVQRPVLEKRLRQRLKELGAPNADLFRIRQREPGSTYTAIVYIQPKPPTLERFGMDLEATPFGREGLAKSRDNNSVAASGTRIPIISGPNQYGLAMRLPVYRRQMPIDTIEQRRAAYIGSLGIAFGVNSLIAGVVEKLPIEGTRVVVTDTTPNRSRVAVSDLVPNSTWNRETEKSPVLYDSHYRPGGTAPAREEGPDIFHVTLPIEFNERTWIANFSIPRAAWYTNFDAYYPWLAAVAGSLTAALLYALFQTMASSRRNAIKIAEEMTKELRTSKANLQASHEKLRRLAAHTDQIKEGERKRIAREIHDELGQNLLALRIDAEMLTERSRSRHGRLHARAEATLQQIDATIRCVREIINDLRPNVLDLGLNAAVDWLVRDFEGRTGIACFVFEDEHEAFVDDLCATAFFRILQESLSNVMRHSKATEVRVKLTLQDEILSMSISDNGIGLRPGSRNRQGSFGLVGIEERVNLLGGVFTIDSSPGAGTTLLVEVPILAHTSPARSPNAIAVHAEALPA